MVKNNRVTLPYSAQEAASSRALRDASFDYSLLQAVAPGAEAQHEAASDSEVDEDDTQAALIAKGRITSAHLYSLGPVTAGRARVQHSEGTCA